MNPQFNNSLRYHFEQQKDKLGRPHEKFYIFDRESLFNNTTALAIFFFKPHAEAYCDWKNKNNVS